MNEQTARPRVLILDDDAAVRETLLAIVEWAGFSALGAKCGNDFLASLQKFKPDFVILDLVLPDTDGLSLLRDLANSNYRGRVIIASGLNSRVISAAARAAQGLGLDVAGVLFKPFNPKDLKRLLTSSTEDSTPLPEKQATLTVLELEDALVHGWVEPYYQPKICPANGSIWGVEALARIVHPKHGVILPAQFIEVAERNGLINDLTVQMLQAALGWLQACPLTDCRLALNLSRNSTGAKFAHTLHQQCNQYNVQPQRVTLEITETAKQASEQQLLEFLTRFRIQGFELSLDDFGVGYSSLVDLARMPFSEVKIDKTFVTNLQYSPVSQKICTGVVALAKAIGMEVTAEGVEDHETLEFLSGVGCDRVQGYWFARPMPGDQAYQWLAQYQEK